MLFSWLRDVWIRRPCMVGEMAGWAFAVTSTWKLWRGRGCSSSASLLSSSYTRGPCRALPPPGFLHPPARPAFIHLVWPYLVNIAQFLQLFLLKRVELLLDFLFQVLLAIGDASSSPLCGSDALQSPFAIPCWAHLPWWLECCHWSWSF